MERKARMIMRLSSMRKIKKNIIHAIMFQIKKDQMNLTFVNGLDFIVNGKQWFASKKRNQSYSVNFKLKYVRQLKEAMSLKSHPKI
jgi:hypothetical protein